MTLFPVDQIGALGAIDAIDALEEAVRGSIEGEASWLETQHALLRRALLQLQAASTGGAAVPPAVAQAERALQLVTASFRERLGSLDSAVAAISAD